MSLQRFKIYRGNNDSGKMKDYEAEVSRGMVVLDIIHKIQADSAMDLAVRWNCKAGKCGSCSVEINGKPKLACMTRMNEYGSKETISIRPIKAFPLIKDLVTNVSWNYNQNKKIKPFAPDFSKRNINGDYIMSQESADRVQEFRKCIECFLCQNVCHVLRDQKQKNKFVGPRFMIRLAGLEMHPLDSEDRIQSIKEDFGSGMCNITKCCTDVCPEHIQITDNAIIPLKERVVDRFYDPIIWLLKWVFKK